MHVEQDSVNVGTVRPPTSAEEMQVRGTAWRVQDTIAALCVSGITLLALALRFWHLGDWNFQGTEMFTLRDSDGPQFGNPRPLGYILNYYLVRPFIPLDEFGLRLLPAIFGVLAIPVFYFVTRRLIGSRAALIGALLVAVSPLLIMYSQLARYWSLVFLLCTIYPFAIYAGVRERDRRKLVIGLITAILAVFAHPVSVLLIGGPLLLLVSRVRREHLAQLSTHKSARWIMAFLVVLGAATLYRTIPILHGWITMHDKNPGSGQFLLRPPTAPGIKQLVNLGAFLESLTFPLAVIGLLGIYLLWRERSRWLALFLASLAVFPLLFLGLLSLRTPISQYYFLPVVPVFFVGAGIFVDRLFDSNIRPRGLVPATIITIVILAGLPTLISDYRDGRRFDFRSAARWLENRLGPNDVLFSDQPMVLAHYLSDTRVQKLRRTGPLEDAYAKLQQEGDRVLWIVAPAPSHAFRANLKQGGLIDWIYGHCQVRSTIGVGRLDLRQDYLHVYRCPPAIATARNNVS
jgi:mannosyltransferase